MILIVHTCSKKKEALITLPRTTGHILVNPTSLSESLCVSERGGGGEICPFSIRLLFPSLTDGDSSGERDLVL